MPETFETTGSQVFEVNTESRTITGLVVPFDVIGENSNGQFAFTKDADYSWPADVSRVKLLLQHDFTKAVGHALSLEKTDTGIVGKFKVKRGADGDEALQGAEDKVNDGLSMGLSKRAKFTPKDGVQYGTTVPISEVSLTPLPAFDDSRVMSVAASAVPTGKEPDMGEQNPEVEAPAVDFTPVFDRIKDLDAKFDAFQSMPKRETVKAGEGVQREELPYRFDGTKGEHGFLADIVSAKFGAGDAGERLNAFLGEAFASITTGNVAAHNPVPTRPELYVDNLHYGRPLWNLVTTGTLDDITAFIIPKFASASGLVGAHTQGTEPTEGAFTATTQTITPTALSGKAILNREVVDQGGNPKVDAIIWNEMVSGYFDNLETAIATVLGAVATTEINIGGGADDGAKLALLTAALAKFQFLKGGDRFSGFAADPTLYGFLTAAKDTTGRPLLPILGATNSDGSKRASLESVQVGAKTATPAWALAVDADASGDPSEKSFLFVPGSVYAWASAPRRIDMDYKVATVEVGIWGYKAAGVTRDSDVVPVDATTSDTAD